MGFAWIETTTSSNPTPFQRTTMFQPSSNMAETFAVLTTLIISPANSHINIFTDSLNTIHNYNKFSHKHLAVTFMKVKSHSEDQFNDQADQLSKEATNLSPIFLSPKKNNDNGSPCSFHNDKITGHKIKLYAHLLPTADLQQRNYPNLYPFHPILCTECNSQTYDNSHIGYYLAHLMELNQFLRTAATYLGSLITSFPNVPPSTREVILSIERSTLFSQVTDINHPTYLLFHQLVPEELISLIHLHIHLRKSTMEIVELFVQYFYTQITRKFWHIHSNSFHSWEKSRRIIKRKKQSYQKNCRTSHSQLTCDPPNATSPDLSFIIRISLSDLHKKNLHTTIVSQD
ncbi:hypothetical protein RclHR1_04880014 [Rhizophagus clarus]|uniref:Uncharacterized protein n=1 Tax=Rhizophagus clarus TaxID=94130 RepID=A0A2Z6SDG9_9GLOM|nr:hypothetical protein RclHR1_04880014 [Rhizophagus clarus]